MNELWKAYCNGGLSTRAMERHFGVPKSTIHDFVSGKTYRGFKRDYPTPSPTVLRPFEEPLNHTAQTCVPVEAISPLKILIVDSETTSLDPDFGDMLCFQHQWFGVDKINTAHSRLVTSFPDYVAGAFKTKFGAIQFEKADRELVQYSVDMLNQADVIVTHNGKEFDAKFVQTRAAILGIERPYIKNDLVHVDTLEWSREHFKLKSHSLDNLARLFKLDVVKGKCGVPIWRRAMAHDPWALKMIAEYGERDVVVEAYLFEKALPSLIGIDKRLDEYILAYT